MLRFEAVGSVRSRRLAGRSDSLLTVLPMSATESDATRGLDFRDNREEDDLFFTDCGRRHSG